jgi:hypothetical protein
MRPAGDFWSAFGVVAVTALLTAFGVAAQEPPDAPDARATRVQRSTELPASYGEALARWKSVDEIAAFAAGAFVYDRARALLFAESGPAARPDARPALHAPEAFYAKAQGVCLDLARFGVETLNRIDPTLQARYLMIEFEPVVVDGATLRRHWLATFRRDGEWWFFADSRRPGHVAGPYATIDAFIADYARYRGRPIVAFGERESVARRVKRSERPSG